jgi:D-alanyl-D-alanine dipeptidase
MELKMIINFEEIENFCKLNDFVIITDELLAREGMYKNLVYATENNFVGKSVYPKEMPIIMDEGVWQKLVAINNELKQQDKCITIYDAYRPIPIQRLFWDYFYSTHGYYDETLVANPNKYGTHNIKINAIDMFISNIDGTSLELPCEFDDFSEKANIHYSNCSEEAKYNRDLLINTAKKYGLIVNESEWWHFYDDRLLDKGMRFNFAESDLKPVGEEKTFTLIKTK